MMNRLFLLILLSISSINLYSQNPFYLYTQNDKKGFVDENGIIKIVAKFDDITDLKKDDWTNTTAFLIEKDKKVGLMDYLGNWIYPLEYEEIFCQNNICKLTKNKKEGYGNLNGKLIIPIQYEKLGFIKEGKISALENEKWGYINLKNEWIIKPQFNKSMMSVSGFSEGFAKVCLINQENGCGYINETGQLIIPQIYDKYSGDFHSGLAKTYKNNKLAYINQNGKIAFPSNWNSSSISDYINGAVNVNTNCKDYDDYGVCTHYIINTKGENILPKNCIVKRSRLKDNYTVIQDTLNNKQGVIDNIGKIIVPIQYSDIGIFDYPFDWISVSNYNKDKYELDGFYNREGKKMTECKYQICGYYSDEKDQFICIDQQNGEGTGVLDRNGKEILPPIYGKVDLADNVFVVDNSVYTYIGQSIKPSCGYFNKDGSKLFPMQYSSCSRFNNGLAVVLDEEGWKIIDKKNNVLAQLGNKYKSISRFSNGRAIVTIEDKNYKQSNGLINKNGKLIVPLIYEYMYHYNDVIVVKNNQKYGIINADGGIIIPLEYDNVSYSSCNNKVYGNKGDKIFWYDLKGKLLSDKVPFEQCNNEE